MILFTFLQPIPGKPLFVGTHSTETSNLPTLQCHFEWIFVFVRFVVLSVECPSWTNSGSQGFVPSCSPVVSTLR